MGLPFGGALASQAQSMAEQQRFIDSSLNQITRTASENSAWSAQQAHILREWQAQQNAKAMRFNASEAAKNRDWQEMMSNSAHQREIADLKAAGLNPVLSAMNGNGASVTSGATASGVTSQGAKGERDTSANAAIVGLLGSFLSTQTQLEAANINARTQEAIADKYAAVDALAARLANEASHYTVDNPNTIWGILRSLIFSPDGGVKEGASSAQDVVNVLIGGTPTTSTGSKFSSAVDRFFHDLQLEYEKYDRKYGKGTAILPGRIKDALRSAKK